MKRIACFSSLLGIAVIGGSAAMGVDLDNLNGAPAQGPKVASAMAPVSMENPEVSFDAEPEEPERWISGHLVGSWTDGFVSEGSPWSLDEAWMTVQKSVDSNLPFDIGYRVDALFGRENAQCYGDGGFDGKWGVSDDGYGASIYQGYAEIGLGKLSAKVGKFGTLLGVESFDAAECDFKTHSYQYENEPLTHSGVLFDYAPGDVLDLNFGLVAGADNSFGNRWGDTGFLFGATLNLDEHFSIGYASELMQVHSALGEQRSAQSAGYYELGGEDIADQNEYLQTVSVNLDLAENLHYTFGTNYGTMADRATKTHRYSQYGFANYLTHDVNDKLSHSVRYEYYLQKLQTGEKNEGRFHDLSYAIKYKPCENVYLLPEIRYDWVEAEGKDNGVTGAVAVGVLF